MGISLENAKAIIRAHLNSPIVGRVLVCGRQSVTFSPQSAYDLFRSFGIKPTITPAECDVDVETREGGEGRPALDGSWISDRSFFKMLGVDHVDFLDHSIYEGAGIIADLNKELPSNLEGQFDFIIDGGTLDNVWNPSQAIMNLSRMLRPGGRLITYNFYANFRATYTNLPQQWYLDYFALNQFSFAQTYINFYDSGADDSISVYQTNHKKRAASRSVILNFPTLDHCVLAGMLVYAVKASDSTWDRPPSQECYRDEKEWGEIEPAFKRFAEFNLRLPILQSTATRPITLPGYDEFEFIDASGAANTEGSRVSCDHLLFTNCAEAIMRMDRTFGNKNWGVLELGDSFYQTLKLCEPLYKIIAKSNVHLFDFRMLNETVDIGGARKSIKQAEYVFVSGIPILVFCADVETDMMWRRLSQMLQYIEFFSAPHTQANDGRSTPARWSDLGAKACVAKEYRSGRPR